MKHRSQILTLGAAAMVAAALALPAASPAEYYVPPANSAANQYTESFPGAGGESGGKRKDATPGATLGAGNAKKLESQGKAGKEAAEVAAETAPPQLTASGGGDTTGTGQTATGQKKSTSHSASKGGTDETGSGSTGSGGSTGGGSSGAGGGGSGGSTGAPQSQGSSGLGQVLGQATGADDGSLGLWLPLAIVLTLIGSVAYWVRTRHAHPEPSA